MRGNLILPSRPHIFLRSIPALAGEPPRVTVNTIPPRVYPRACGGTRLVRLDAYPDRGLSPRLRGNPTLDTEYRISPGSIPALAGEPDKTSHCPSPLAVYPRACGGTTVKILAQELFGGLSPRLRGNLRPQPWAPNPAKVYPRACGGTCLKIRPGPQSQGLSPRLRGNHRTEAVLTWWSRSIPALAGEPATQTLTSDLIQVYPRACGGTAASASRLFLVMGLSPRLRGNHRRYTLTPDSRGSIPALAGEPRPAVAVDAGEEVYPRACGGTFQYERTGSAPDGLSPRLRGNPYLGRPYPPYPRSIPALAGEPFTISRYSITRTVYPRACGGTFIPPRFGRALDGLSPRLRGNPSWSIEVWPSQRSIPALAGEPLTDGWLSLRRKVYPRACGGTLR